MRNKIIVALCTVALLFGVMPLCISAYDLREYTEFYIPSPDTELPSISSDLVDTQYNENEPILILEHAQDLAWGQYNYIEIYGIVYQWIMNYTLSLGDLSFPNCNGFNCIATVKLTKTNGDIIETEAYCTFVKNLFFNPYTQKNEINYAIILDSGSINYPILISNNNLRNSLPAEMLIFTQDYVINNTSIYLPDWIWEELQTTDPSLLEFFEFIMRPRPIIYDKYLVKDYANAMNNIIESAQTGIATWTTNPLILTILCIVMAVCILTVLWKMISLNMRGGF